MHESWMNFDSRRNFKLQRKFKGPWLGRVENRDARKIHVKFEFAFFVSEEFLQSRGKQLPSDSNSKFSN